MSRSLGWALPLGDVRKPLDSNPLFAECEASLKTAESGTA